MKLSSLLDALSEYKLFGSTDINIAQITDDSRNAKRGCLFVATKGLKVNAHKFIPGVIEKGAQAVVGEGKPEKEWLNKITYIKVSNSRKALGLLASCWFDNPSSKLKIIGITGTKGKTTTVHLIHHILSSLGKRTGLISSITYPGLHITTPGSLELQKLLKDMVDDNLNYAVIEVSSHGIDQDRIAGIEFEVGVLTNIAPEHLDYHKTFEEYKKIKMSFINTAKAKIICPKTTKINILPGKFNNLNAEAAVLAVQTLGIDRQKAISTLKSFKLPEGRLEEVENNRGIKIYIDFAHTPDSLEAVLVYLKDIKKGRLVSVFGSAGERDAQKRPKMGEIAARYSDTVILTSEDPRSERPEDIIYQIKSGIPKDFKDVIEIVDRKKAIAEAIRIAESGDTVALFGKGHEKSMNLDGINERPWSEHEAVREALKNKFYPKGILLDVDGTLTNSKREISPNVIQTVKNIARSGIYCGVSTSRHYAFIKNYILPHFPQNSIHITSGGGQIVTSQGKVIWEKSIDSKKVKSIIKEVEQLGGAVIFGSDSILYCSDTVYENVRKHPWKVDVLPINKSIHPEVYLLSIVRVNSEIKKYINSLKNISAWFLRNSSGSQYIDIVAGGVNKLTAARIWCRKLGIGLNDILAVGDNENDYELIDNVGFGVAMGNSPDKLKKVAKKVIGRVDEDALPKFLASLLVRNDSHG